MSAVQSGEKRDLVLNPLEQAFLQDLTRGPIKTYVGPCVVNQTAQDRPVRYNHQERTYRACGLDDAVFKVPIASEGDYIVLENPSQKIGDRPEEGSTRPAPALDVGRKINIPGPCTVPLWPGQNAEVIKGHNLRSNQYLLVRIYNEDEAKQNWGKAVIKKAEAADGSKTESDKAEERITSPSAISSNLNLSLGQLLIIKGTEISFYIPPTGVEVLKDEDSEYVRDALTLERLTYCMLVDQDGNKRYEKGPQVVFPKPTEAFMTDPSGARKFRAIELNPIQGIHIKVISPYSEGGVDFKEGDDLFITGKETAIYYPRQEHSIITYGGQLKHFATALPAGEGRYVMNRNTGDVRTEVGPKMLLPDPRNYVTVKRILTDRQCELWYPDGAAEAKEHNRSLRAVAEGSGAVRKGMVVEAEVKTAGTVAVPPSVQMARGLSNKLMNLAVGETPPDLYGGSYGLTASGSIGSVASGSVASGSIGAFNAINPAQMPAGFEQAKSSTLSETFQRSTTYTPARSIALDTKYDGVPSVSIWTGYAVMVVNKRGGRRVEQGPKTILLDYDESLEVFSLSTGKPKNTDKLEQTVYLRVMNNKVSDIITIETSDHVPVQVKVAYRVSFQGEPDRWFETENYVKLLCDHARSVLKGKVQRLKVEDFYRSSTDIVRDIILGQVENGKRPGMVFEENGMRVTDVEVLGIQIDNDQIRNMLTKSQYEVVSGNIAITQLEKALEVTKRKEQLAREQAEAEAQTTRRKQELTVQAVADSLTVTLAQIGAEMEAADKRKEVEVGKQGVTDMVHAAGLARQKSAADTQQAIDEAKAKLRAAELQAEADATVKRFAAMQGGLSEALLALGNQETLAKVASAMSVQQLVGGKDLASVIGKLFGGTPVQAAIEKVMDKAIIRSAT